MSEETDPDSNESDRTDSAWQVITTTIVIVGLLAGVVTGFDHSIGYAFLALLAFVFGVRRLQEGYGR